MGESLVVSNIFEVLTSKGICKELLAKVEKLSRDNLELREKVGVLKKHVQDLTEAANKVRIERQNNFVKVPRVTRNVGLQVQVTSEASGSSFKEPTPSGRQSRRN